MQTPLCSRYGGTNMNDSSGGTSPCPDGWFSRFSLLPCFGLQSSQADGAGSEARIVWVASYSSFAISQWGMLSSGSDKNVIVGWEIKTTNTSPWPSWPWYYISTTDGTLINSMKGCIEGDRCPLWQNNKTNAFPRNKYRKLVKNEWIWDAIYPTFPHVCQAHTIWRESTQKDLKFCTKIQLLGLVEVQVGSSP